MPMGILTVFSAAPEPSAGVAKRGSGTRCVVSVAMVFLLRFAGHLVGCVEGGGEDFGVSAAAADVAGDGVAHVGFRGMGIVLEQRGAAHDHTRRTETALHGIMT